mmetsp:Transcript_11646/g.32870  ORF Transcript_11646/g.32870 Transcript_11646/m.32870 type:complete len:323 (-) Transcript_11646:617-1585(-)
MGVGNREASSTTSAASSALPDCGSGGIIPWASNSRCLCMTLCAFCTHLSIRAYSLSTDCSVFSICLSMAAKPVIVCFSHCATCSSVAYRLSETFKRACIRGSLMPASFMPCAVPGRAEDDVPGREEVLGREPPALGNAALEVVKAKVFPSPAVSPASSAGVAGAEGGTGRSSRYSRAPSAVTTREKSSSCWLVTGLPCSASSLSETRSLRRSSCSGRSNWLRERSRISSDCQLWATLAGMSAMQFPARLSSASCGRQGRPCSAFAVIWLPDTSNVAKQGSGWGDPETPTRKDRLVNWFPSSRNSSSLVRPLTCSGVTSRIWL